MPNICFGSNIIISCVLFVTSNGARFLTNFNFRTYVYCSLVTNISTLARPEISSTNGASIFMNFLSFGFTTTCSFQKNGNDLFRNLNDESHMFITNMNTSNLCLYISTITGITNSTTTHYPLPS